MKVVYFLRDDGACGYYRLDLPLQTAAKAGAIEAGRVMRGDPLDEVIKHTNASVIAIPRPCEEHSYHWLKESKEYGRKTWVDHDDNIFDVSPFSNHYKQFGTEDVEIEMNGNKIQLWKDGENYDKKYNQERVDWFKRCLEEADVVTTTTPVLANVFSEYSGNVKVLPNCVDTNLWTPRKIEREDPHEIRLYWGGGSSHYEDLALIHDVMPQILDDYNDAKFVMFGQKFHGTLKLMPREQVEFHDWVPTPAYPYKLQFLTPDVGIIPLRNTRFSNCKSAIKWIELGALGVPSVASLVTPYKEMYDGANGVFVENTTEAWYKGIKHMIDNAVDRWNMGGRARHTVLHNYNINNEYVRWVDMLEELTDGS